MSRGSCSELYAYYRVVPANAQAALQAVITFQQRLREQHPGLAARVLRRADDNSGGVTLMETYAFDNGARKGIDDALRSSIEEAAAGMTALLSGPRQTEVFDALD